MLTDCLRHGYARENVHVSFLSWFASRWLYYNAAKGIASKFVR